MDLTQQSERNNFLESDEKNHVSKNAKVMKYCGVYL